jgi:selenocysteine lyase/cysteine desulfurase
MINYSSLFFKAPKIETPFHKIIEVTYADDIASGRPSKYIEKKVQRLLPYYSNTHSNASMGILMRDKIRDTRNLIRKLFKLTDDHIILFTGNGSTAAVNHLKNSIHFTQPTHIYLSRYEHYSNYLPWFELARHKPQLITTHIVEPSEQVKLDNDVINILTINMCSNVTGEMIDIDKYKRLRSKSTFLFLDMSCCAPYINIDLRDVDAVFMSGHKFFGGVGCPGILVARKVLFNRDCPTQPGGSCVKKADSHNIVYSDDLETRESAGTPNIIGIIKFGYVLQLKEKLLDHITKREHHICGILKKWIKKKLEKYPDLKIVGDYKNKTLPILSFCFGKYHPNLLVKILNDVFGIQTRGGISCCGLLGEYYQSHGINGWCRVSLSWWMTDEIIYNILDAVELTFRMVDKLIEHYHYDSKTNLFTYIVKSKK